MSDIDEQTIKWLRSLKLSRDVKSIRDFHNGYYFGEILSKMGLAVKQTFQNKNDLSCIFQNYKEVRDVLSEKLSIDLPTDNLIGKAKQILLILQQFSSSLSSSRYATGSIHKGSSQTINANNHNNQTKNYGTQSLPRKIVVIEQKLQKFRDQHSRQQQSMREEQKKEIALQELAVQERVREDRQKIHLAHTFIKDQDKRIMEFWNHTEQIKLDRIEREHKLTDFLHCKKENQLKLERQAESKGFQEGLQAFQQNCMRLGIDVEPDPDRIPRTNNKQFNKITFLQRIADKTAKEDLARKDKVKRLNNLQIMQKTTAAKAQEIYEEQNLLQKYAKISNSQTLSNKLLNTQQRKQQYQNAKMVQNVELSKKRQINIVFDQQKEEKRQQQYRQKKIQYMEINLARKTIKRQRHQEQAQDIINKFINMSCEVYDDQRNTDSQEISKNLWSELVFRFLENIPGRLDKSGTKDMSKSLTKSKFNKGVVSSELNEYIAMDGSWVCFDSKNVGMLNNCLSEEIAQLIDLVFPPCSAEVKEPLSSYMPLKLCLFGNTLSGRHTQALKLAQKYGISIIDLNDVIKEALILANPPVQQKKGAKKDPKKGDEEKPEKVRLRELGMKLKEKIKGPQEADTETLLQVFKFKVRELFPQKTEEQISHEFKEAEQKTIEKHAQAVKQYQDALKKVKKDPKKPISPNEVDLTPKINPNPYTKGFVIVGFPDNLKKFIEFQKTITGYITPNERINIKATENRTSASQIVFIEDRKPRTNLEQSYLDHVISLDVEKERLEERNQGRKLDPNTGISYHPKLNPCVPQIKGLVDQPPIQIVLRDEEGSRIQKYYEQRGYQEPKIKVFERVSGNEIAAEVFKSVQGLLQRVLNYKTSLFKKKIYGNQVEQAPQSQKLIKTQKQIELQAKAVENLAEEVSNEVKIESESEAEDIVKLQLSQAVANLLLKRFNLVCEGYSNNISSSLNRLEQLRNMFTDSFYNIQGDILTTLLAPDDKNIKILSFQDSYNKLLSQKEGLVQIEQAKTHLLDKLDKLYDGLWDSIKNKKDEAVEKRRLFMNSSWLVEHSQQLLEAAQRVIQTEVNKATELIEFAVSLKLSEANREILEGNQHINYQYIVDPNVPIFDFEDSDRFPQLQNMISVFEVLISTLADWFKKLLEKSQIDLNEIDPSNRIARLLDESIARLELVSSHLFNHLSSRLREYRLHFQLLLNRMDDWIIYGIKKQNDVAYGYIKEIKRAINEAKKSNFSQNTSKQINEVYTPYQSIPNFPIPIPESAGLITPQQIKIVVSELKSISSEGKISVDLFNQYIERRLKASLFPESLRNLSFDSVHQYLVQDEQIYLEELATCFILLGYNIPSEEQIEKLYVSSEVSQEDQYISFSDFFHMKTFIDQIEYKRAIFIKYMLSEILGIVGKSINIHALCATLTTLNRMGAESFSQIILQNR